MDQIELSNAKVTVKKTYESPKLNIFGDLRSLTQGGSGNGNEVAPGDCSMPHKNKALVGC